MTLINRVINFLLFYSVILATISIAYAGFLMLSSGGNSSKVEEAKSIFTKVIFGFIFAFLAWVIVHFILTTLGVTGAFNSLL